MPTLPATATAQPGDPVEVAEQLGRGGLAVGAGDRDEGVGDQPPGKLELPGHLEAALPRGLDHRGLLGHSGALYKGLDLIEQLGSIHLQADFDARLGQTFRLARAPRIAAEDALTALRQQASDRRPRAGQPDHQKRPLGQRRPRLADRRIGSHNHLRPSRRLPAARHELRRGILPRWVRARRSRIRADQGFLTPERARRRRAPWSPRPVLRMRARESRSAEAGRRPRRRPRRWPLPTRRRWCTRARSRRSFPPLICSRSISSAGASRHAHTPEIGLREARD